MDTIATMIAYFNGIEYLEWSLCELLNYLCFGKSVLHIVNSNFFDRLGCKRQEMCTMKLLTID